MLNLNDAKDGMDNLVLYTFDEDGNPQYRSGNNKVLIHHENADQWETLEGEGLYTDCMVTDLMELGPGEAYKVTVQQSISTPGYYRIVNPYGKTSPFGDRTTHTCDCNHYIYINAVNPQRVYIERSIPGVSLNGSNYLIFSCAVENLIYESPEDIDPNLWGTKSGQVITLPENTVIYNEYPFYYWHYNVTPFRLELPESGSVNIIMADEDVNVEPEYFNMQGVRVADPVSGQLLIRRQGTRIDKISFK